MNDRFQDHQLSRDNLQHWLRGHHIISDQISPKALEIVCSQLETVLDKKVPGAVVELGCYVGTTSLFLRRILDERGESDRREFHVYDSFKGLPPKSPQDSNAAGVDFEEGKLYVSKKEFLHQFRAANLRPPVTHKGWFDQLGDGDVPKQIAFAFLDGDFYDSILTSLRLVWPRLAEGARILVDDYKRQTLPGVERAIRDFTQGKLVSIREEQNIAIILTKY